MLTKDINNLMNGDFYSNKSNNIFEYLDELITLQSEYIEYLKLNNSDRK